MATEPRPGVLPRWASTAAAEDVVSAPAGKLDSGWVAGEAPPHDWFNFEIKNPADWIRHLAEQAVAMLFFNWEQAAGSVAGGGFEDSGASGIDIRGGDFDPITELWVVVGNTDGCNLSRSDGRDFEPHDGSMASTVALQDVAVGATSTAVAVGGSATMYRSAVLSNNAWGTVTAPGSPTFLASIVYDTFNTRHITVGNEAASEPYVATANDSTGTAFTDRSAALPSGFDGKGLESLAVDDAGIVVAGTQLVHDKLARSGDGGVTWSESTTTLVSGIYHVTWSVENKKFYAVRINSLSNNNTYTSTDGLVWMSVFTGSIGFDAGTGRGEGHRIASFRHALVVSGALNVRAVLAFSFDDGATWTLHGIDEFADAQSRLVASRTQGKLLAFHGEFGSRSTRGAIG